MRIAMIGCRGVPATYGGIERHVEEVGARLAQRGHEVTVYARSSYVPATTESYRGMTVRRLPTAGTKHLEAILHSGLATLDAGRRQFDVLHYHAVGPAMTAAMARVRPGARVVATVHGLDSRRGKWGGVATRALTVAEWLVTRLPHRTVVVSADLQEHFRAAGRQTTHIVNGVSAAPPGDAGDLAPWQLQPGRYVLFVGRLVPEKAPDLLVRAFAALGSDGGSGADLRLVIVGGSSHSEDYVATVRRLAGTDGRVVLPGYLYGPALAALYSHAAAFVLPSLLEGLPLTLLEAVSYGTPVVASSIAPHVEVLGAADSPGHRSFASGDVDALTDALRRVLHDPAVERAGMHALQGDVLERYSWDSAVDELERTYELACAPGSGAR